MIITETVEVSFLSFAKDAMRAASRARGPGQEIVLVFGIGGANGRAVMPVGLQCVHPFHSPVKPRTFRIKCGELEAIVYPRTHVQYARKDEPSSSTHRKCPCFKTKPENKP